jgi:hypothetical protein
VPDSDRDYALWAEGINRPKPGRVLGLLDSFLPKEALGLLK